MAAAVAWAADPQPYIGYIRVSTWHEEKISPELQKEAIEAWAARNNCYIIAWIEDLDATGRNFNRKIMIGITAVEQGRARGIAVWKYSRFGRTRHGVAVNLARVEKAGGQLQSATEQIDASTATGKFTRGMLFEVAAFESDRAGEQWAETHKWRLEHGLPAAGGKRWGYTWHRRVLPDGSLQIERYELDLTTGPTLADVYRRVIGGTSMAEMARRLNRNAVHTPTGRGHWTAAHIRQVLLSGFGAGLLVVHQDNLTCDKDKANCTRRDHRAYLPGAHPAAIETDEWEAYLDLSRSTAKYTSTRRKESPYLLTGLVRCRHCKGRCQAKEINLGSKLKPRYVPRYYCVRSREDNEACTGGRIYLTPLEQEARTWVQQIADKIDAAAREAPRVPLQRENPAADQRKHALKEVNRWTKALVQAAQNQALTPVPADIFNTTITQLSQQRDAAQKRLDALPAVTKQDQPEDHRKDIELALRDWDIMPTTGLRKLLQTVLRHVYIDVDGNASWIPVWASPEL
jgi:site-specific DNA recombinase